VIPTGKVEPELGLQAIVRLGQEPTVLGVEYVTVAEPEPGELSLTVLSSGQLILQVLELIVTVKLQAAV
jgi:hypothetical protein